MKNKIDGHTHTELCPHGSGEPTAKMIKRAIQLGFDEYHITEHAPLPERFMQTYSGDPENVATASLRFDQLDQYFALTNKLRKQFADQIKITVGFEVDYLVGYEKEIRQFLNQVGPKTSHNILSVHYLPTSDGRFFGIDYSPAELKAGFGPQIANGQALYHRYFQAVLSSVKSDLGPYCPDKIGHMSLIKKYQDFFHLPEKFDPTNLGLVKEILAVAHQQKLKLDFNTAGLYKPYCNDLYPGHQIIELARQMGIPLEFGSDAHSVNEVGHGYHLFDYLK